VTAAYGRLQPGVATFGYADSHNRSLGENEASAAGAIGGVFEGLLQQATLQDGIVIPAQFLQARQGVASASVRAEIAFIRIPGALLLPSRAAPGAAAKHLFVTAITARMYRAR
jgi:hypothetical protein